MSEITKDWNERIVQDTPEEAAQLLAIYEHNFAPIKKHGFPSDDLQRTP